MVADAKALLKEVSDQFVADTSFFAVVGAELEFYLHGQGVPQLIFQEFYHQCNELEIGIAGIEKERGDGQFEIQLRHIPDPVLLADHIIQIKQIMAETALRYDMEVDFSAKPYDGQPGNGLHIHINLLDEKQANPFVKQGEEESPLMRHAIAGLLEVLPASMRYFSPTQGAYNRYQKGMEVPSTLSWGGNNRTVALRLPATTDMPQSRRIEHRVPASDANPYSVLACILLGMRHGIIQKREPAVPKIYGNASEEQYALEKLPETLQEARSILHPALTLLS